MERPDDLQDHENKIKLSNGLWVGRSDWLVWRESLEESLWENELEEWHQDTEEDARPNA